jgi:hypothetical protein
VKQAADLAVAIVKLDKELKLNNFKKVPTRM